MSPRRYDLGRRRSVSEATRERILETTRAMLGARGDPGEFSMEAVAEKAGVSRMTVYNQFRSRAGLLDALADQLAAKGGMQGIASAFMDPQPESALRKFVATFVGFWASDRMLLRRLRAMGVVNPAIYRGVRDRDEWRRQAARNLVGKLVGDGRSASEEGIALVFTLTSFETFDALCTETRSPEAVAKLIADSLVELLGLRAPRSRRRVRAHGEPSKR